MNTTDEDIFNGEEGEKKKKFYSNKHKERLPIISLLTFNIW